MKRYHDDSVKVKQRELLKSSIERNLLSYLKPQDIRVLCFPGIDGMEIVQVYDALNIPRKNITGLEHNPQIASTIRQNFPDISVPKNGSLEDYLKDNQRLTHQVISLDFTQNMTKALVKLASEVGGAATANRFIYHIAFQKQRESAQIQNYLRSITADQQATYQLLGSLNPLAYATVPTAKAEDEIEIHRHSALQEIWGNTTCRVTLAQSVSLMQRIFKGDLDKGIRQVAAKTAKKLEAQGDLNQARALPRLVGLATEAKKYFGIAHILGPEMMEESHLVIKNRLLSQMEITARDNDPRIQKLAGDLVSGILATSVNKLYRLKEVKKYAYVSESGTAMMGDIGYICNDLPLLKKFQNLVNQVSYDFTILNTAKLERAIDDIYQDTDTNFHRGIGPENYHLFAREFLGSSAKPILRKLGAIELLQQGLSPKEIKQMHRGMSTMQIAAIKAHMTMGTYRNDDNSDAGSRKELQDDIEARIIMNSEGVNIQETLDKQDILSYLRAGISPVEIKEAYPALSLPRIHALDHWRKKKEVSV